MASGRSDAIQNALLALVVARPFAVVSHSVTGVGQVRTTAAMETALPKTAVANCVRPLYGIPRLNRRIANLRELIAEEWQLHIEFDQAVSIDAFETYLMANTPVISRNPSVGIDHQITLMVEEATIVRTPVAQQPAQGTKVTFRFTAELTPS